MKKQIIVLTLILSIGLAGCEKFLTELPQDTVAPETFFKTKEQLTAALMPVYSPLGATDESTYSRFLSLEANSATDEYSARSAGTAINAGLYNASASYANFTNCWNNLYLGIERANFLLEQLETSSAPQADIKQVKGEALFLRAYYHFILVGYWGDIPLKLTSTKKASDVSRARTPAKEVYDQIIKDMTEAEGLVKTSTAWGVTNTGRVSKTAIEGILSRVCLHAAGRLGDASYLPAAVSWGKKVVASNEHRLNPDYTQVFKNHSQDVNDNKENLWEVEFMRDANGIYSEYERFGSTIGVQNNDVPTGFAQAGYFATGTLYDSYADGDLRRDWTIANYSFVGTDASKGKTYLNTTATASTRWRRPIAKWRREFQKPDVIGIKNFGPTNYPLLRYSDVLLTLAEADNAINGPTTENVDYVNQVRRRAYGVDLVGRNVIKLTITNGGVGSASPYTLGSIVTISGGGAAKDAKAVITGVTSGRISGIALIDGGAGYISNPTVTVTGGSGAVITPTVSTGTEYLITVASFPGGTADFLAFIKKERSRELTGEGHHKLDMFRWGTFLSTMQAMIPIITTNFSAMAVAYTNVTARDVAFPIPISEMELNPLMKGKQNPGWD